MTKKQINQLVQVSYKNNKLDRTTIERIVSFLSRHDLKLYVRGLKLSEKAKTISLVLPDAKLYNTSKKIWKTAFKNKHIVVEEDRSLLLGIKVIDNDMIYDMSLKNNLDTLVKEIAQ